MIKQIISISFLVILGYLNSFSQSLLLKGKVINSKSKEAIPYCMVGLKKANIGTTTDENGYFSIRKVNNDTLIFRSMGYVTKTIAVENLKENIIELNSANIELPSFTVKPNKSRNIVLNEFEKSEIRVFVNVSDEDKTYQIAQYFAKPDSATWFLREVRLARFALTGIAKEATLFKLRFYGTDKEKKPDLKDLCEPIIVDDSWSKIIKVDLSDKHIILPTDGLFIAIEWIKIENNKVQDKTFKEQPKIYHYTPMLGLKNSDTLEPDVYILDYTGTWKKEYRKANNLNSTLTKKKLYSKLAISLVLTN